MTQDGPNEATIDMGNFEQGIRIVVVNGETSSQLINAEVTQDTYSTTTSFVGNVNLQFTWTKYISTDELYTINIWENSGGVKGRLIETSSTAGSGTYTYTGKTDVIVDVTVSTSNGDVLNKTSSVVGFTYLTQSYTQNPGSTQWGIDGTTPWGSNQYHTGRLTNTDPVYDYKRIFVRTSLGTWTRYLYRFDTRAFSTTSTISTGVTNYGASDQVTLVDNL